MKTIYLDRNIILSIHENRIPELKNTISQYKNLGYIFPYSPAHVEEIVGANKIYNKADTDAQLELLKEISGEISFMPNSSGDTKITYYNMKECLSNVQNNDGFDMTKMAIYFQSINDTLNNSILNIPQNEIKKNSSKKNNIAPEKIFLDSDIQNMCVLYGCQQGMSINSYFKRLEIIQSLCNILDIFGYRKDASESQLVNKIHDVSHLIYSSCANILVSDDKKLNTRARAIFPYIGSTTKVLFSNQFINILGNLPSMPGD